MRETQREHLWAVLNTSLDNCISSAPPNVKDRLEAVHDELTDIEMQEFDIAGENDDEEF